MPSFFASNASRVRLARFWCPLQRQKCILTFQSHKGSKIMESLKSMEEIVSSFEDFRKGKPDDPSQGQGPETGRWKVGDKPCKQAGDKEYLWWLLGRSRTWSDTTKSTGTLEISIKSIKGQVICESWRQGKVTQAKDGKAWKQTVEEVETDHVSKPQHQE